MRKDTDIEIYEIVQPMIESAKALHPEGTPLGDSEIVDIVIQVLNMYR